MLTAGLACAAAYAAHAAAPLLFEELRWTAQGAEIAALARQPAACLSFTANEEARVTAGQALFNSPALLGGQAARAGLSCASCHVNGRDNPHFLMAGVSDRPGTADVTHSFFGPARGNAQFDPVAIPDLAAPGKIARDPAAKALERFIRTLIVEEFAGQEPSPAMLAAIAGYVRAVGKCPGDAGPVPRRLEDQLVIVRGALAGAVDMAKQGDAVAARALLAAARRQLGMVSERYASASLRQEREGLLAASRALQPLGEQVTMAAAFAAGVSAWTSRFESGLAVRLRRKESHSLYDPRQLGLVAPSPRSSLRAG